MLISVVIPTYNNSSILAISLISWVSQTLPGSDYEVLVVDNNSSDNTAEVVQVLSSEHPHIQYYREDKPGATQARHTGARHAKADILLFVDDDGVYNSACLSSILDVYRNNASVEAVAGKINICWDKAPPVWIEPYEFMLGKLDYGNSPLYREGLYLNGGLFSIKKSTFNRLSGFNPDLVGGYLIGDGDTGLVMKLHQSRSLIGWTPFAVMDHLQFIDRHATVRDIGRRFFNVGVSKSYGVLRQNGFIINTSVLYHICIALLFLLKKQVEYVLLKPGNMKTYFSLNERKGQLNFFIKLCNSAIRKEILQTNYINQ